MTNQNSEFKKVESSPDEVFVDVKMKTGIDMNYISPYTFGDPLNMYRFNIAETWRKIFVLIDKCKTIPPNTNNEDNG